MILLIDRDKPFGIINTQLWFFKNLSKLGLEGNLLNLIKGIYNKKPTANIFNDERSNAFLIRPET